MGQLDGDKLYSKPNIMKLQTALILQSLSLLTLACNSYKTIAHEKKPDKNEFYFSSVDYFGRNCSEFFGTIKERKKVLETVVYYTCSPLSPVKILYNYDDAGNLKSKQLFVSVNVEKFEVPITEREKYLFQIIDNKNRRRNYENYRSIKGFRKATENDNIYSFPFIRKLAKRQSFLN